MEEVILRTLGAVLCGNFSLCTIVDHFSKLNFHSIEHQKKARREVLRPVMLSWNGNIHRKHSKLFFFITSLSDVA